MPPLLEPHFALIEILRRTLERIESGQKLAQEDRSLAELKRMIVLMVAEHEQREHERQIKAS